LCGDFNAWHIAWGDISNARGKALLSGLEQRGLGVKKGDEPTRIGQSGQRNSYVDLVISNCCKKLDDVHCGFQISDHVLLNSAFLGTNMK
jgi:hypothetical protein